MKECNYFQTQRILLLLDSPFFGVLAVHLQEREMTSDIEKTLGVPTCGTDGRYLYVNPEWVKKLSEPEKLGLLCHEVLHNALGHIFPWRRAGRDARIWNAAGDYAINLLVKEAGLTLPTGGLLDNKYKDLSTEQIYDIIYKNAEKIKVPIMDIIESNDTGEQEKSEGEGKGEGEQKDGKNGGTLKELSSKELEEKWKELIVNAAIQAKGQGKLPAGVERLVHDLLFPKLPWQVLLANIFSEIMRDDYDECQLDQRFISQKIYLPDLYSEGVKVTVGIDTSGSIGEDDLKNFLSETFGILNSRNVTSIRLLACDAAVHFDKEVEKFDEMPMKIGGGGGTDFRPIFDALEDKPPAVCVIFTDLAGTFPEETPRYPVIWVSTDSNATAPFGTIVCYDTMTVKV